MIMDPEGYYRGTVVAVFQDYKQARIWGAWDIEYIPSGGRDPNRPFYLFHCWHGAVLIGDYDARPGLDRPKTYKPSAIQHLLEPILKTAPRVQSATPSTEPVHKRPPRGESDRLREKKKTVGLLRRRKPVIGVGGAL